MLFAFYAITFILGLEFGGFQLALLRAANELGFDGSMMGLPITIQFLSISLFPLIFGPISDRIGKKKIIAVFMAVFVLGCFLVWTSETTLGFLIGIFVLGAGFGVTECSVTAAISDIYTERSESIINLCQSYLCVGAIVSPLILQVLMDEFSASWRVGFFICMITMAVILPMILYSRFSQTPVLEQLREKIKLEKPLLLLGLIICFCIYVGIESSVAFFIDTVFTLEMNFPELGAYAISLFWAAMWLGRFIIGHIKKIPKNIVTFSLFAMSVVFVLILFCRQEYVMLVLFFASGLACSCVWPGIVNLAIALNRKASGKVMSYLNLGAGIGGMLIPLLNGMIMNLSGMSVSFLFLIILSIATGAYILKNQKQL